MLWTNKNIVFSIVTDTKLCAIGKPMRVKEQLSCNSIQSLIGTLSLSTMRSRDSGMWGVVLALPKSILRCKKKHPPTATGYGIIHIKPAWSVVVRETCVNVGMNG
jgi:hypothetical protein